MIAKFASSPVTHFQSRQNCADATHPVNCTVFCGRPGIIQVTILVPCWPWARVVARRLWPEASKERGTLVCLTYSRGDCCSIVSVSRAEEKWTNREATPNLLKELCGRCGIRGYSESKRVHLQNLDGPFLVLSDLYTIGLLVDVHIHRGVKIRKGHRSNQLVIGTNNSHRHAPRIGSIVRKLKVPFFWSTLGLLPLQIPAPLDCFGMVSVLDGAGSQVNGQPGRL
ncbi:uncharacterized protein HMPREF1120_06832 [Exophiala dermatitidis NIH/UT8656]|uniref:Uncharacterized protein n=1 Tax=Exophiala dermatitidis (strain ATCC 34100 / CBS 525.76 / NIH/UT8656) TaxID=858893 RepID=H6C2V6_EXODN|nr:uncharacterized protein HMPREF1120_06832 [Exophiala dermatitidis NIH/UT8656]EHY58830.1 hypothetical protein HMPREF1120_06832 [Exophiala dermatitidis NIH/UT8656]